MAPRGAAGTGEPGPVAVRGTCYQQVCRVEEGTGAFGTSGILSEPHAQGVLGVSSRQMN